MGSFDFDIADVAGICGIPLNYWPGRTSTDVNCPFCEDKKKHLNLNFKKNVWRCNNCGAHGGMLDLYAQIYGVTAKEAYREIEKRLGKVSGDVPERKKCVVVNECTEDPYAPADIARRDVAYRFLLTHMKLTDFHRQNLLSRGLTEDQIKERCYKSVPVIGHARIVVDMIKAGIDPKGVPGFYISERNGQKAWTLRDFPSGIMIPVRDIQGRIEAIQIRLDNTEHRKFRWLSTNEKPGGSHTFSWCHFIGPVQPTMYLTEGPMKADIIHFLSGRSVIAVPGVNCEDQFVNNMELLRQRGVKLIVLAFDMDSRVNPNVQKAQLKMEEIIHASEMELKVLTWPWDPEKPEKNKGLDDFLWAQRRKRSDMECVSG